MGSSGTSVPTWEAPPVERFHADGAWLAPPRREGSAFDGLGRRLALPGWAMGETLDRRGGRAGESGSTL